MKWGFLDGVLTREYVKDGVSQPSQFVVWEALYYISKALTTWIVPRGFITDFASIPRLLRWVFNINGKSRRAAVLHDYLYVMQITTRAEADAMFLEALEACGVDWATRQSMYLGVRSGGWIYWNKRSKPGSAKKDFVPEGYFDQLNGFIPQ